MKPLKLIALAVFIGTFSTLTTRAQDTCWRIVGGPGAGIVVRADAARNVFDLGNGHAGYISPAVHQRCECLHYHGILFGEDDPAKDACGWGCVVRVPCSSLEASVNLRDDIDEIAFNLDEDLANKLDDILDLMNDAASIGCYSVVEYLADAFADEMYAGFADSPYDEEFDSILQDLAEYVSVTHDEMDLGYTHVVPTLRPFNVMLLERIGSGMRSRLVDAGPRITARIGQLVSLEAYGMDTGVYRFDYKFKGADTGELPSGVGLGYYNNHISVTSMIRTSVRIGVGLQFPDHKPARDSIMINFIP